MNGDMMGTTTMGTTTDRAMIVSEVRSLLHQLQNLLSRLQTLLGLM